jgi:predicted ester cyclase
MSATSDLNKANTVRFFDTVFNQGETGLALELLSSDYKFNGVPTSPAATRQWADALRAQFPDLHFSIERILAENDSVALRWRMTGTRDGVKGYVTGTNILVFAGGRAIANDQAGGDQFIPL